MPAPLSPCTTVKPSGDGRKSTASKLRKSCSSSRTITVSSMTVLRFAQDTFTGMSRYRYSSSPSPRTRAGLPGSFTSRTSVSDRDRFDAVEQIARVEGHRQVVALEVSFDALFGPAALGREHRQVDTTFVQGESDRRRGVLGVSHDEADPAQRGLKVVRGDTQVVGVRGGNQPLDLGELTLQRGAS